MQGDDAHATEEARQAIRFALSQLRSRDAHHEFEHLATALARMTVTLNVLPSTGPVAGAGDQGRDAETYRTQLAGQVQPLGRELRISDGDGVAFACTLQQGDVLTKLEHDVEKIAQQGTVVGWVAAYCEANVKSADRHKFQKKMLANHSVHVEVFDGNTIAELLAQRNLYWIARQYLNLSERTLPVAAERPGWYEESLARWQSRTVSPVTMADVVDVKAGMRFATANADSLRDLPFWLGLGERGFADHELSERLRMDLGYDLARSHLRGQHDLRPADDKVAAFISHALDSDEPSVLEDAAVLVTYAGGAKVRGLTDIGWSDEQAWGAALLDRVSSLLDETTMPGRRCALLDVKALLQLRPNFAAIAGRESEYDLSTEVPILSQEQWREGIGRGELVRLDIPSVDVNGGLDTLVSLAESLPAAPLYPVRHLATMLVLHASALADDPRFAKASDLIDDRVADVEGSSAGAAIARDRAMQFVLNDRLLLALRELHKTRSGWFSGDHSRATLLACLITADCYHRLRLPMAAKYFSLIAIFLVQDSNSDLLPRAMFLAAHADYDDGAWFAAVQAYEVAMRAHDELSDDPDEWSQHVAVQQAIFALTTIAAIARRSGGPYEFFAFDTLARLGIGDLPSAAAEGFDHPAWWDEGTAEEVQAHAAKQLGGPVFSDSGARRIITWSALGVAWSVEFANDYEETIVGERLAAMLQVMAADFARRDPASVPTRIRIELSVVSPDSTATIAAPVSDGTTSTIRAALAQLIEPSADAFNGVAWSALEIMLICLAETSVLPPTDLQRMFEDAMEDDLINKCVFGTAYDIVYRKYTTPEDFDLPPRRSASPLPVDCEVDPVAGEGLEMPSTFAPGFDRSENRALIARRYEKINEMLPVTLAALRNEPVFQEAVGELRAEGWLDWHILLAVFNVAHNLRHPVLDSPVDEEDVRRLTEMRPEHEPVDANPLPTRHFTAGALRMVLPLAQFTILKNVASEPMQNPPDQDAVRRILISRLGFYDDVEHDDPFISGQTAFTA
jgi:hypothetical protein